MESSDTLIKANTTFCLDLFKQLSDLDKTANVFFSPVSISSALAMVLLGAKGNTASQMSEVLRFTEEEKLLPGGGQFMQQMQQACSQVPLHVLKSMKNQGQQDDVHAMFSQLLKELNKPDAQYVLSVANRLYGEQTYAFEKDFLEETKKHYRSEMETVDFKTSFEIARVNINTWVEEQTQDKIKDVLPEGALSSLTRLVLVNAIYFKGDWNKQFEEDATRDAQFRLNKNDTKPVKMMYQKTKFPMNVVTEFNLKVLELPYKGKELSMFIFLPMDIEDSSTGLEKLEKDLTYDTFMKWTHPEVMDEDEVQVGLPRFKLLENYDMKRVLVSMGMVDAFDVTLSDFAGMSTASDLVLSKVIHKAFVEVNEEGTEAAAATAVTISVTSFRPSANFIADHPFLFFIRHNESMSVLFAGRFCSPE
uniref:leukocyte elastase inhibitor-like n=1 Tax=Solea senegalensis TaxID=28829 RepID=UPI001CD83683|nr:leukocyte elastase inhibitor-like [Solea senegalensis]